MGIPIGGGRGRRRRSYADYRPTRRATGPRSDPFRVALYLLLIAGVVGVLLNPAMVLALFQPQPGEAPAAGLPENSQGSEAVAATQGTSIPGATAGPSLDPESAAGLAQQAYMEGKLDEAIEYYREAAAQSPNTVDYPLQTARLLLFRSAMEYGSKRDATLEEALEAANDAILADPFHPGGYAILGKIKDWQNLPEEGQNYIGRALEADENYALAHAYLAEVLVDLNRWQQAQTEIDQALSLDPNNVDILRDYAYILESLGDYQSAVAQYERALQIHPRLPYLRMSLGRAYRVTGLYEEAIDQFFQVETVVPGNALILFEVGRTYESGIGDPVSALEYYQRAVEIDESFALPWVRIGTLQYQSGDYRAASIALERAVALGIETTDVYSQLAMAYINLGQCGEAMPHLQKARDLALEDNDERILDLVNGGYETCSEPIPTPEADADS